MCAQNLRPHLDVGQLHGWGTMPKTLKSAAELAEMIVAELRKHSEYDTIKPIRITLPATKNWDITTRYDRTKLPSKGYKILSVTAAGDCKRSIICREAASSAVAMLLYQLC